MLTGIDVASYQGNNPNWGTAQVAAIKVDQGTSYVSPAWLPQLASARSNGIRIVFYHYPNFANSVASEVHHFLSVVSSHMVNNDVLCLDWEWYDQPSVTPDEARVFKDTWFSTIKELVKQKCILYSDVNNWTTVDQNSNCGDGLWIAAYNGQPDTVPVNHPWIGHQYSDNPVDLDAWNFPDIPSFDTWATSGVNAPVTTPSPVAFDPTGEPGFPVWDYKNPATGEDAWSKLCVIEAAVKAIQGKVGA